MGARPLTSRDASAAAAVPAAAPGSPISSGAFADVVSDSAGVLSPGAAESDVAAAVETVASGDPDPAVPPSGAEHPAAASPSTRAAPVSVSQRRDAMMIPSGR